MKALDKIKEILDANISEGDLMFSTPHFYNKPDSNPRCEHHSGGDNWCSDVCACFMSSGAFELLRYIDSDDLRGWNNQCDNKVVAWMEL